MDITQAEVIHRFTNHPPSSEVVGEALDAITDVMISTGDFLIQVLPEGREKSLAITKLEEVSMWSKAAVARNQGE